MEFGSALRNYRQFVLETVEERRLPPQIATVRQFFARLAICIRVGNCDQTIAAAQLRPAVRQFRNQHYYYFPSEGAAAEFDHIVALITPDEPWLREARRRRPDRRGRPAAPLRPDPIRRGDRGAARASAGRSRRGS